MRKVESFKTEQGSVYSYDKDLKSTRKTADGKQHERKDITVFANLTEEERQNFLDAMGLEGHKVYIVEAKDEKEGKIVRDISQVQNLDSIYLTISKGDKIVDAKEVSLIPKEGHTVFEMRHFVDPKDNQEKTKRHFGHKVTEIKYKEEKAEKQKTIAELEEEMQILKAAYAPVGWFRKKPVMQDLGYYVNQNRIEEIKAEIEKLKAGKPAPAEGKEEIKKDGWIQTLGKKIREQKPKEIVKKIIEKTKKGIETADKLGKRKKQKRLEKKLKKLKIKK